jgi:hypothetical protein
MEMVKKSRSQLPTENIQSYGRTTSNVVVIDDYDMDRVTYTPLLKKETKSLVWDDKPLHRMNQNVEVFTLLKRTISVPSYSYPNS